VRDREGGREREREVKEIEEGGEREIYIEDCGRWGSSYS
jgi:predicted RNA-binding protein with TRAM domain